MENKEFKHNIVTEKTWFIIYDNSRKIISYGDVGAGQIIGTKWDNVDYITTEEEWLNVLTKENIDPYKEYEE
jgi:hypothetical protein